MFDIFDTPINAVSCAGRDVSTVAPQALWLMNNRTAFGQSERLAARLVREAGKESSAWVDRAWRLALGRVPTKEEAAEAQRLIDSLEKNSDPAAPLKDTPAELASLPPAQAAALTKFCLALFNLNEFIYID
jgi:hypothetical protein